MDKYVPYAPTLALSNYRFSTTGLLPITEAQFEKLQSLFFTIGDVKYEMTPNAQIWPRDLNAQIGGEEGQIYLVVADMGSNSGSGLDFIGELFDRVAELNTGC